jgi:hypothetical protein
MRSFRKLSTATCAASVAILVASVARADFNAGDLLVSRSVYTGTSATVTVGQALPGGGTAVADGSYPNVFENVTPDPSFGVTSPIFIDDLRVSGSAVSVVSTLPVPSSQIVTSFSSKSEMALNLSTDGKFVTFMGYIAPANTLDVSNSNTPNHPDPTDPVQLVFQRGVAQVDSSGHISVTAVNTYSGNNGRAAIFDVADNQYLLVGNAGNGSGTEPTVLVDNTGVQTVQPGSGPESTPIGVQQGTPGASNGFQFGYSVTENGLAADKSGKDDNFRGIALFNSTLYVTKGSGSNGINTVYQVGTAGSVPTAATASTTTVSVLPGFPVTLAKNAGASNPFGIWFASPTVLYVADEGDGKTADAASSTNAGIEKWLLVGGVWQEAYVLQQGLNLGVQYSVAGLPTSLNPAPDGLRALTGKVNGDGTVTLYGTTSTVSAAGDTGADPNQLVTITDTLSFTTAAAASAESFSVLETAPFGQVLRGVSFSPVAPAVGPATPVAPPFVLAMLTAALLGLGMLVIGRGNVGNRASA